MVLATLAVALVMVALVMYENPAKFTLFGFLMPKLRTKYVCQQCGGEQSKWVGKCPDCGAWNTLEEVAEMPQSPAQQRRQSALAGSTALAQGTVSPIILPQVQPLAQERIQVGYA